MWPTDVTGEANLFLSMALKVPSPLQGKWYSLITFIRHHVPSKNQHLALTRSPGGHFKRRVLQHRLCFRCHWPDLCSSRPQCSSTFRISQWGEQDAAPATAPGTQCRGPTQGNAVGGRRGVSHISLGTHLLPWGFLGTSQKLQWNRLSLVKNTM